MRIADICTRDVVQIDAEASLREAATIMRSQHVGTLVVTGADGSRAPGGILTDRDIVLSVVAVGIDLDVLTVGDVMTADVATCREGDGLFDAIHTMHERGVRRLPVLDDAGGLAGIVAADDIYAAIGKQLHDLGYALARGQVREMRLRNP
ncbi:CBS domain-containing protein [Cognatiluteimonas weifangensis]